MAELHDLTAVAQREELRSRRVSPRELVVHYLDRIERLDPELGAFVEVTADAAIRRAEGLNPPGTRDLSGTRDPSGTGDSPGTGDGPENRDLPPTAALWGMPFADKDLVARAGVPTRYGSRAFLHNVPERSDDMALLFDDAGAISLGKTNTPEFGLTGYTETLIAPPARDPWNRKLGAGGSSGGAAVAVAMGLVPFAPASDGGGSIRIPSASVGVVGLKPSRGRLPIGSGLDGLAGLAVGGPIARTVADAALLLDAMIAGRPYPYAVRAPGTGPFLDAALRPDGRFRIGVSTVSPWDDAGDDTWHRTWHSTEDDTQDHTQDHTGPIALDPTARAAVDNTVTALGGLGHDVEALTWSPRGYPELFTTLWRASAARIPVEDAQLHLVEPVTSWLIRSGRALGARELADALAAATVFERETIAAFAPFDAVLTPALAQSPRPIGWFDAEDARRNFSQQVRYAPYSSFVNVAGLPAIVLPVTQDPDGHPVAIQLVGRPGGEHALLAIAAQLERGRGFRPPPGW